MRPCPILRCYWLLMVLRSGVIFLSDVATGGLDRKKNLCRGKGMTGLWEMNIITYMLCMHGTVRKSKRKKANKSHADEATSTSCTRAVRGGFSPVTISGSQIPM